MATIVDLNGMYIAEGLQSHTVCDQAIIVARSEAECREENVILDDDDRLWLVHPDGSAEDTTWGELGFNDDEEEL